MSLCEAIAAGWLQEGDDIAKPCFKRVLWIVCEIRSNGFMCTWLLSIFSFWKIVFWFLFWLFSIYVACCHDRKRWTYFSTCQVRVTRFYHGCAGGTEGGWKTSRSLPSASSRSQWALPDLNGELPIPVRNAGLNRELLIPMGNAGPQ